MTFMLGNHEEMVLRGNLKYTRSKYKDWQHLLEWSMPICGMRRAVGVLVAFSQSDTDRGKEFVRACRTE